MPSLTLSNENVLKLFIQFDDLTLKKEDLNFYHIIIPELGFKTVAFFDNRKERDAYYIKLVNYIIANLIC